MKLTRTSRLSSSCFVNISSHMSLFNKKYKIIRKSFDKSQHNQRMKLEKKNITRYE